MRTAAEPQYRLNTRDTQHPGPAPLCSNSSCESIAMQHFPLGDFFSSPSTALHCTRQSASEEGRETPNDWPSITARHVLALNTCIQPARRPPSQIAATPERLSHGGGHQPLASRSRCTSQTPSHGSLIPCFDADWVGRLCRRTTILDGPKRNTQHGRKHSPWSWPAWPSNLRLGGRQPPC